MADKTCWKVLLLFKASKGAQQITSEVDAKVIKIQSYGGAPLIPEYTLSANGSKVMVTITYAAPTPINL